MLVLILVIFLLWPSDEAFASLLSPWHYIKNYHLGFDVGERSDLAHFGFEISQDTYFDETCEPVRGSVRRVRCVHDFEDSSSGFGIFIEQPFKRRGFWHFDYDLAFDLRIVDSKLHPVRGDQGGKLTGKDIPVKDVYLHLYSLVAIPYLTVGVTPLRWPELLLSFGPTGEAVWGSVNINDTRYQIAERGVFRRSAVGSFLSHLQLNLILKRFGKGYFGITSSQTKGDDHVQDGKIFPESIDNMSNMSLHLNKQFFGVKVLLK